MNVRRRVLPWVAVSLLAICVAVVRRESRPEEPEWRVLQLRTGIQEPTARVAPGRSVDHAAARPIRKAPVPSPAFRSEASPPPASAQATSEDISPPVISSEGPRSTLTIPAPSFSTFRVSRVGRTEFALASPTALNARDRVLTPGAASDARSGSAAYPPTYRPWDGLTGDFSTTRGLPESGDETYTAQYGLTILRLVPTGRLELQARIGDRDGRRHLSRGAIRFRTFTGWEATLGDSQSPSGCAAFISPSLRGGRLERLRSNADADQSRVAVAVGRCALTYRNIERGRYPRRVESASVRYRVGLGHTLDGQAYHLADKVHAVPAGDAIRTGQGGGLSVSKVGVHGQASAFIYGSDFRFAGGGRGSGAEFAVKGRARAGRVDARAAWQSTVGTSYRVGGYGELQPIPRLALNGSLSTRLSRTLVAGGWASRWEQPLTVADRNEGTDGPVGALAEVRNRSTGGDSWGGQLSWTVPKTRTGVSLSSEVRHRTTTDAEQDITSHTASAAQPFGGGASTSLRWNRLEYRGLRSSQYLTGGLRVNLGRSASLSLEQGTTWQEPFGPRLVSSAAISPIRLLGGRVTLSAQVSQMHEQERGRFLPVQTQAAIASDLRLGAGWWISPRFQVTRHRSDQLQTIQVSLSHTPGTLEPDIERSFLDPRPFLRQVLDGSVFSDANGDGIRQDSETGIPGVAVLIDNDPQTPVYTDGTGHYRRLVGTGRHLVRILPESVPTLYALRDIESHEVTVEPENSVRHDFPMTRQDRCISGCIVRQLQPGLTMPKQVSSGESVSGIRVFMNDKEFTYTDAAGNFQFRPLSAGTYEVQIDPKSLPFGHVVVGDSRQRVVLDEIDARCEFLIARPVQRLSF